MRVILASASPRRRELLQQIAIPFEVITSAVEEHTEHTDPALVVEDLSAQKAQAVLAEIKDTKEDILVIGADTIVSCDGRILGKPKDAEDAAHMLERLQDRGHEVFTGMTLLYRRAGGEQAAKKQFHEKTQVFFYPMTAEEIAHYIQRDITPIEATGEGPSGSPCKTYDWADKAGGYGIQGFCARYIREIQGDYNNVVGLPVGRLYQEMKGLLGDEEGCYI